MSTKTKHGSVDVWKKKYVSSNKKRCQQPLKKHNVHKASNKQPATEQKQNKTSNKPEAWMTENLEEQKIEFESIKDIYSDEIIVVKEFTSYQIKLINETDKTQQIYLDIKYPLEYPSKYPPIYSISTSFLKQIPNRTEIENTFSTIWDDNKGQTIMFEWISEFKEFALIIFNSQNNNNAMHMDHDTKILIEQILSDDISSYCSISINEQRQRLRLCPEIIFCEKFIQDRKSLFKSFAAKVGNIEQIKAFIDKLKSNKRIAKATHNMVAYRLSSSSSGIINEHYDDDGEHGGGKVILEILRKRDIVDVVIMVTRWYGGIHLSSDRFKHIKTMTQYVLEQGGFTSNVKYEQQLKQMKPTHKDMEKSKNICNRLYWSTDRQKVDRKYLYIGCKCRDKKLNDVIEFNVEEYGVQKSGIEWVQYVSYKGLLVWDVHYLPRTFQELDEIMQNL